MVELRPEIVPISPNITELHWSGVISEDILMQKKSYLSFLKKELAPHIRDIRCAYHILSIRWQAEEKNQLLKLALDTVTDSEASFSSIWEVPVCYGGDYGKDLIALASAKAMSEADLIDLHSSSLYRIHFFGFMPGFMYLAGLDPMLFAARKKIPERLVPPGSVAIGGQQTGIYPSESPGGWHLIGRTPLRLFDPKSPQPVWANVGDEIRFRAVSEEEFDDIRATSILPKKL
ncbi:5-oxoprolinase subunit PxpB [Algoriphagus namhaensis]